MIVPSLSPWPRWRLPGAFLLAVASVYTFALWLRPRLEHLDGGGLVALGLTVDLVVGVPLLYYLLLVRLRRWPVLTVVPVTVASFLGAAQLLPREFHGTLDRLHLLAAPLELLLLGGITWRAAVALRRFRRAKAAAGEGEDVLAALRNAARQTVGTPWVAEILAFEIGVLYYAFGCWRRGAAPEEGRFTAYRKSGYPMIFGVVMAVMAIELAAVHLLVHFLWSPFWAWVLSGLSLYGALWLVADFQALRHRPTRVTEPGLTLRIGFRWEVEVPWQNIAGLHTLDWQARAAGEGRLNLAVVGEPSHELVLREPVTVRGVYGLRKSADRLGLALDDGESLRRLVTERTGTGPEPGPGALLTD
jgi:hypothetical protein